jgi:hypothetical protein
MKLYKARTPNDTGTEYLLIGRRSIVFHFVLYDRGDRSEICCVGCCGQLRDLKEKALTTSFPV